MRERGSCVCANTYSSSPIHAVLNQHAVQHTHTHTHIQDPMNEAQGIQTWDGSPLGTSSTSSLTAHQTHTHIEIQRITNVYEKQSSRPYARNVGRVVEVRRASGRFMNCPNNLLSVIFNGPQIESDLSTISHCRDLAEVHAGSAVECQD